MLVQRLISCSAVSKATRSSCLSGLKQLHVTANRARHFACPQQQLRQEGIGQRQQQQQQHRLVATSAASAEVETAAAAAAAGGNVQQQQQQQKPTANLVAVLRSRGLVQDITSEDLEKDAASSCLPIYCGFDPTADSLHLGNLLGIIVLAWAGACGHRPIALLGGATGRVGDPSGRSTERPVLSEDEIQGNVEAIGRTLHTILGRAATHLAVTADGTVHYSSSSSSNDGSSSSSSSSNAGSSGSVMVLNNLDWFGPMSFLGFLRDVGKHARVGQMLAKDSVRSRMESESGISFTEFTYQLLQGYDYVHLAREHGVRVQVGGSDQWGNIIAGTDLIRKLMAAEGQEPPQCYGLTFPLLGKVAQHQQQLQEAFTTTLAHVLETPLKELPLQLIMQLFVFPQVAAALVLAVALLVWYVRKSASQPKPVYLLDFAMAHPPDTWRMPKERFVPANSLNTRFNPESLDFLGKMLERSGLGNDTYTPPWLVNEPICMDIAHARLEFEVTCFGAIQELLNKTGVQPRQIGCVIVNSSLFNPTPSLAACIMNHFKMGSRTINYNLGGMGCSASLVAIDLARQVLQTIPDTYALVVSHENITNNWYPGNDRSMLLPNCIFRCNGAAMLLTNKPTEERRSKYELQHLVRVNLAGQDRAYRCVYQLEDENGELGVRLSKDLTAVAASALQKNMVNLGPLVLPFTEKFLFAVNLIRKKLAGKGKVPSYTPDFSLAFDHICIHSGGRAVIDGMQKHLALTDAAIEPSRAGLYRWGNVSSASVWYVLSYIESFKGVRKSDKVWQLSFGSGFKCNSAVWVARKTFKDPHSCWAGFDAAKMWEDLNTLSATIAAEKAAKKAAAEAAGKTLPDDGH